MLNNIETITITPQNVYQLILGTNGSGKSSILHELSPLPAHRSNYNPGGYKLIEIEHRGYHYILESNFKSSGTHTCIRKLLNSDTGEWEDLNPGKTGAVQKEVVWQHFGLNSETHELMIGFTNFTDLDPNKRREWITKLSDVDFSYALGVYKKLRTLARDRKGAIKHTDTRIAGETNKLLAIGDLKELESTYQSLQNELTVLMTSRDTSCDLTLDYQAIMARELNYLQSTIKELSTQNTIYLGGEGIHSKADLIALIESLKVSYSEDLVKKSLTAQQLEDFNNLVGQYKDIPTEDLDGLFTELTTLKLERDSALANLVVWKSLKTDPVKAQSKLSRIAHSVIETLNRLPANPNRLYTKAKSEASTVELTELRMRINKGSNILDNAVAKLEHLNSLKDTECPKCGHAWVPGISEGEHARLKATIATTKPKLEQLRTEEAVLVKYLEAAENYHNCFYQLKKLTSESPELFEFWDSVLLTDTLLEQPKALVSELHTFVRDLETWVLITKLNTRIEYLEPLFDGSGSIAQVLNLKGRVGTLTESLEALTSGLIELDSRIKNYESKLKQVLVLESKIESIFTRLDSLSEYYQKGITVIRETLLKDVIVKNQYKLAHLQTKHREKQTLEGILKDLVTDKTDLVESEKVLKILADELSPIDGLIAEQLKGFIESLIEHVNLVIAKVWTYELKVIPCGLTTGDLDYKFPLLVRHEGSENLTPDISKGSEAQLEIVNLAFRMVIMGYLGFDDYPIYLDEFGRAFDEQHRLNGVNFIKQLGESGNYSQVFLISHYMAQFGSINQADVLVLDSSNISINQRHNEHVLIT